MLSVEQQDQHQKRLMEQQGTKEPVETPVAEGVLTTVCMEACNSSDATKPQQRL
jgi:hypothetical protein